MLRSFDETQLKECLFGFHPFFCRVSGHLQDISAQLRRNIPQSCFPEFNATSA
jgi:hypothetical protein